MKRYLRGAAVVAVLAIVAASCGKGEPTPAGGGGEIQRGGTLTLGSVADPALSGMDPTKEYYQVSFELLRCCLVRTLLSYNGRPTDEGGTELFPDLAEGDPTISDDRLTWTFTLKQGLHYAPPMQDVEIVAQDFIRAIERAADPEASADGYPFYYSPIEGFDEFSAGDADSISGLSAPDPYTLEVRTSEPAGDLGYIMALPASGPIPEGAADGHARDYGRFLVSSGPYMFEGSENLDFSLPPKEQEPVSGYEPNRSMVMVRNPTWEAEKSSDTLRKAYVDRIEITVGGTEEELAAKVDAGEIDFAIDSGYTPEQLERYSQDPALEAQLHSNVDDAISYSGFNVAEPPFDDVHIRKAVNWITNKDALRRIAGGPLVGEIAGNFFVDGVIGGVNHGYDPYETPNGQGDLDKAMEEMKLSAYDTNQDGLCDAPECEDILTLSEESATNQKAVQLWEDMYKQLGMTLDNKPVDIGTMYSKCGDPAQHVAFCPNLGWGKDYPDGNTFGPPLFGKDAIAPACCNTFSLGATPEQLEEWGYEVTEVPSVDEMMSGCLPLTGDDRNQCWAEVDRYIMEEVVPVVPRRFINSIFITSPRVVNYQFDQFAGMVAIDQIALSDAGEAAA